MYPEGFQSQPVVYTTYTRAVSIVSSQSKNLSFILAAQKLGQSAIVVAGLVASTTGLADYTSHQFIEKTLTYFITETSIVMNFGLSVLIAFLIGTLIAGQTFYNFTMDNLRHFGALKAMGAGNRTLLSMIVLQAVLVGAIGYGLGVGAAALFGELTKHTALAFKFPWGLLFLSAGAIALICVISAFISIRKVFRLEPAIVFKG